jgi:hypothetical protein
MTRLGQQRLVPTARTGQPRGPEIRHTGQVRDQVTAVGRRRPHRLAKSGSVPTSTSPAIGTTRTVPPKASSRRSVRAPKVYEPQPMAIGSDRAQKPSVVEEASRTSLWTADQIRAPPVPGGWTPHRESPKGMQRMRRRKRDRDRPAGQAKVTQNAPQGASESTRTLSHRVRSACRAQNLMATFTAASACGWRDRRGPPIGEPRHHARFGRDAARRQPARGLLC